MKIAYNSANVQTSTFTSPPQGHLGRVASFLLTAESGLARCVCY